MKHKIEFEAVMGSGHKKNFKKSCDGCDKNRGKGMLKQCAAACDCCETKAQPDRAPNYGTNGNTTPIF